MRNPSALEPAVARGAILRAGSVPRPSNRGMDRTFFHIDRCDDEHWAVHVDGGSLPVVFTDRAEAVAAALGIARAKWEFAGQPTAVTFPIPGDGTDVLLFGGACNDEEE